MDESGRAPFEIEVCWIGVEPPLRIVVSVQPGTTVAEALVQSGVAARLAGTPLDALTVAVFGRRASPDRRLHAGDRIELLPPLRVDPKVARQRRAEHRRLASGERRWARDRELPARPDRVQD